MMVIPATWHRGGSSKSHKTFVRGRLTVEKWIEVLQADKKSWMVKLNTDLEPVYFFRRKKDAVSYALRLGSGILQLPVYVYAKCVGIMELAR